MRYFEHRELGELGGRGFKVHLCSYLSYLEGDEDSFQSNAKLCHGIPKSSFHVFQHPDRYDNGGFPECLGAPGLTWCYHFIRTTLELRGIYAVPTPR